MEIAIVDDTLSKKLRKWEKKLKIARSNYKAAKKQKLPDRKGLKAKLKATKEKLRQLKKQAKAAEDSAALYNSDNLTRINGIGPKIQALLKSKGICSFRQLSRTRVAELKLLLRQANFNLHNPATWATQARLASAGRWEDLELLQQRVKSNRRLSSKKSVA